MAVTLSGVEGFFRGLLFFVDFIPMTIGILLKKQKKES